MEAGGSFVIDIRKYATCFYYLDLGYLRGRIADERQSSIGSQTWGEPTRSPFRLHNRTPRNCVPLKLGRNWAEHRPLTPGRTPSQ